MTVLEELDRVSAVLAEKLKDVAESEQCIVPSEDPAARFSDWTNGVGWGDFTRMVGLR